MERVVYREWLFVWRVDCWEIWYGHAFYGRRITRKRCKKVADYYMKRWGMDK